MIWLIVALACFVVASAGLAGLLVVLLSKVPGAFEALRSRKFNKFTTFYYSALFLIGFGGFALAFWMTRC